MHGAKPLDFLGTHDRKLVKDAARALRRVPAQGAPVAMFNALRSCTPVAGGLIGTMREGGVEAIVSHAVGLPDDVLEAWASSPREQLALMLAPLSSARPGQLISDTQAIVGPAREEIGLLDLLRTSGLGEAAGYKVGTASTARSRGLLFLTFALEGGRMFSARDHAILSILRGDIQASLERLRLPLIPSQPILAQVVEERLLGFICVTVRDERCVELNQRARELVQAYHAAAFIEGGQAVVSRFARCALTNRREADAWRILHPSGERWLEVSTHALAKETHVLGEDLWLIMLQEVARPRSEPRRDLALLTPRQREIVHLMVTTGLSIKELADHLGIKPATASKHAENIYRRLKIQSRPELVARFR